MKRQTLLTLIVLGLASLACTLFIGGPDYPATPIPISTDAVGNLEQEAHAAATAAAQNGVLTLTINESQLTSLVAAKLAEKTNPLLTDPQVYLRDGQIQIYGKAVQGQLQANVRIVVSVSLDASGQPVISVISTDFGPLPAPEGLNKTISAMVQEAFTGAIGPAAIGFRLENITIADGVMTITGRVK